MIQKKKDEDIILLDDIFAKIPTSVYYMNRNFVYLGCSDSMAKLLNLKSRHDIVDKTYSDLYDEQTAAYYRKVDEEVMTKGVSLSIEEPLYLPDGTKLMYLSNKEPIKNSQEITIGMIGTSTDITERKKMEDELRVAKKNLEHANQSKEIFIRAIAQEVRGSLEYYVLLLGKIKMGNYSHHEIMDDITDLYESNELLMNRINKIIATSKFNIAEDEVKFESFDLFEFMNNIIRLQHPSTKYNYLEFKLEINKKNIPRYLVSDTLCLEHIFLNLLENATKFTKKGSVTLGAQLVDIKDNVATIEFFVKDTGVGISLEKQNKIFNKFYKENSFDIKDFEGYGLGLYVVQKCVNFLKGKFKLVSNPNIGTTVSFILSLQIAENKIFDKNLI